MYDTDSIDPLELYVTSEPAANIGRVSSGTLHIPNDRNGFLCCTRQPTNWSPCAVHRQLKPVSLIHDLIAPILRT